MPLAKMSSPWPLLLLLTALVVKTCGASKLIKICFSGSSSGDESDMGERVRPVISGPILSSGSDPTRPMNARMKYASMPPPPRPRDCEISEPSQSTGPPRSKSLGTSLTRMEGALYPFSLKTPPEPNKSSSATVATAVSAIDANWCRSVELSETMLREIGKDVKDEMVFNEKRMISSDFLAEYRASRTDAYGFAYLATATLRSFRSETVIFSELASLVLQRALSFMPTQPGAGTHTDAKEIQTERLDEIDTKPVSQLDATPELKEVEIDRRLETNLPFIAYALFTSRCDPLKRLPPLDEASALWKKISPMLSEELQLERMRDKSSFHIYWHYHVAVIQLTGQARGLDEAEQYDLMLVFWVTDPPMKHPASEPPLPSDVYLKVPEHAWTRSQRKSELQRASAAAAPRTAMPTGTRLI